MKYQSGWLADTFAIGATYYTSLPVYAPADKPGSLVVTPGQQAIGVVGEAWGALRYKEYALLRGYRQMIDDGYVNPLDNRMVPNTFGALTLSGKLGWARYDVGYVWDIKPRDSNDFISMSKQAGALGDSQGLLLTALDPHADQGSVALRRNYYVADVFNTAFGKAEYTYTLSKDLVLQFGIQYTDQRSVGDERTGRLQHVEHRRRRTTPVEGPTGRRRPAHHEQRCLDRSPYGTWPGYLSLMVTDFDRAGETGLRVGRQVRLRWNAPPVPGPGPECVHDSLPPAGIG